MKPVTFLSGLSRLSALAGLAGFTSCLTCTSSFAAEATASSVAAAAAATAAPANLMHVIISLVVVVGLLIALSMAFKKFGIDRLHANFPVKIVGAMSIGNNQRLMVIEAGDEWVVLGITPQAISALASMPRNESNVAGVDPANAGKPPFSTWMQSTLEKYRVKKP